MNLLKGNGTVIVNGFLLSQNYSNTMFWEKETGHTNIYLKDSNCKCFVFLLTQTISIKLIFLLPHGTDYIAANLQILCISTHS